MLNLIGEGLAKGTGEKLAKNSTDYLAEMGAKLAIRRDADNYAADYRDKLLDLFLKNKGIASKAIPGLAMLLGGGALLGSNKKEKE